MVFLRLYVMSCILVNAGFLVSGGWLSCGGYGAEEKNRTSYGRGAVNVSWSPDPHTQIRKVCLLFSSHL